MSKTSSRVHCGVEGFFDEIMIRKRSKFYILMKVGHTQKINEKPLHCWVSVDATGIILCGHCTCMAGLGEVCTHIGATLFLLADWCRKSKELDIPVCVPTCLLCVVMSTKLCFMIV